MMMSLSSSGSFEMRGEKVSSKDCEFVYLFLIS